MDRFRPIEVKPSKGGHLITVADAAEVGLFNYTVKRDWRRHEDRERRREGYDYFWPNRTLPIGNQPLNAPEGVNLLHLARHPNGKTAIIAGTPTALYRYFALDNGDYVEDVTGVGAGPYFSEDPADYPDGIGAYIDDNPGEWLPIGSGFSASGRRWEAVNINGYAVFNNGVDLPVTYRLNEFEVTPIYELREQGVASVGTIAEFFNVLMAFDIQLIHEEKLEEILSLVDSGVITAAHPASPSLTVTSSADFFTAAMVGSRIFWDSGESRKITVYTSPTQVTVDSAGVVVAGLFAVENPAAYAPFADAAYLDDVNYKAIWSLDNEPRRWGAIIPVSVVAGTNYVTLKYPVKSLERGMEMLVLGAGVNGGNLTATIPYFSQGSMRVPISTPIVTTNADTSMAAADTVGSIIGSDDLQDDGSTILKALALGNRLVIYRDTSIFLASYTGDTAAPFIFDRVEKVSESLYYRNTLIHVKFAGRTFHLFAGKDNFYAFDLISRQPVEFRPLSAVRNLFFPYLTTANDDAVFTAENSITKEVFVCFPTTGPDKALCFDYRQGTVSTTTMEITAAATVKRPILGIAEAATEDWFIMGTSAGKVLLYGKTDAPQSFWDGAREYMKRLDQPTTSQVQSGLEAFGARFAEKALNSYVLELASSSLVIPVQFQLLATRNAIEPPALVADLILTPQWNMTPLHFLAHFYQERLTVEGTENVEILARTWNVAGVNSQSWTRGAPLAWDIIGAHGSLGGPGQIGGSPGGGTLGSGGGPGGTGGTMGG